MVITFTPQNGKIVVKVEEAGLVQLQVSGPRGEVSLLLPTSCAKQLAAALMIAAEAERT